MRHLVIIERVVAQVPPRFDYRVAGHRKRQPAQQQPPQRPRLQVNPFPKTGRPQQRRTRLRMQPVNQLARRAVNPLRQHPDARRPQRPPHLERNFPQRIVRCEQRQQMPVQRRRHIKDNLHRASGMVGGAARIGHILRRQQQRVPPVVERTVHQQLLAVLRKPHPLPQKRKAGIRGQRRAGQNHRLLLLKQLLRQNRRHRQGRGMQRQAAPALRQPLDLLGVVPPENRRHISG